MLNNFAFVLMVYTAILCPFAIAMPEKSLSQAFLQKQWKQVPLHMIIHKEHKIAFKYFQKSCFGSSKTEKCKAKRSDRLIFLLPGRTEPMAKYIETVLDFMMMGFDVLTFDHRGQGMSSRVVKGRDIGHIDSFSDYVDDARLVVERHAKLYKSIYGVGVSMGAIVLEHLIVDLKNSDIKLDKAVFVAPMLAIDTSPYPNSVAYALVTGMSSIGLGKSYATGTGPWLDQIYENTSSSKARKVIGHSWTKIHKRQRVGGPSNKWVKEAMSAGVRARERAKTFASALLLLSTGVDEYVQIDRFGPYCDEVPSCLELKLAGSKHEIFQEADKIREKAFSAIKNFLIKP